MPHAALQRNFTRNDRCLTSVATPVSPSYNGNLLSVEEGEGRGDGRGHCGWHSVFDIAVLVVEMGDGTIAGVEIARYKRGRGVGRTESRWDGGMP